MVAGEPNIPCMSCSQACPCSAAGQAAVVRHQVSNSEQLTSRPPPAQVTSVSWQQQVSAPGSGP